MSQEDAESPPLVDQVVAEVLEALAQHSEFDTETVERLRQLAASGGLAKYESVVSTLSAGGGK